MRFSLVPGFSFREITDITTDFLDQLGIKFLMLDLDNTIAAYDEHIPSQSVSQWVAEIRKSGVELYIVSNSLREKRVRAFEETLKIGVVMNAHKPSPRGVLHAMTSAGFSAQDSALIGDQIFTDTIAANRAGVISIIVKPIKFTNPFIAIRYACETPIRAICTNKCCNKREQANRRGKKNNFKIGAKYE